MALVLKQSTAVDVLIGPFVDLTDGATAEEGESPSVLLSKNGQGLAAKNDVTTPVHDDAGYYNCELDATDTNTVGTLVLAVEKSATALPVRHEFQVVEENVYDMVYASGGDLGTTVDAILDDTDLIDDGTSGLAKIATDVAAVLVDTGTTLDGKLNTIDGIVDDILVDTAEIGAAGAGLTEAGGTGDHLTALATAAALTTVDGNVDAILADTGTDGVVVAAASKTGYALTAGERTAIADATLLRDWTSVSEDSPAVARNILNALRFLRNKWSLSGSTLTVTKEDDSATAWTSTVTTSGAAEPVTSSDPD